MTIEDKVDKALAAWLEAATDRGHKDHGEADLGLCWWVKYHYGRGDEPFRRELTDRFERDGLDPAYPFGEADYYNMPITTCPKRLAWVRKELAATL